MAEGITGQSAAALFLEGMREYGICPPAGAAEQVERYTEFLLEQNKVMNLTALKTGEEVIKLHFLDSAGLLSACDWEGKTLLDVGTGAGFPGLALKLLVPTLRVTLLDSLGKRIRFLEQACAVLGLCDVKLIKGRAEEEAHRAALRGKFDAVTSRAVAALPALCELCLPYVKTGGVFLAMKSLDCAEETAAAGNAVAVLGGADGGHFDYDIPLAGIRRRVIRILKCKETPRAYPRRYAKIQKSAL